MNWSGLFGQRPGKQAEESGRFKIPLFLVNGVLFPGGLLTLKVFEQRYLDMAAACMKNHTPFGLCLIESGQETGEPAVPHRIGTLAYILEADMPQLGILMLKLKGSERFRIISHAADPAGLVQASIERIPEAPATALPERLLGLLPLLQRVVADAGPDKIAVPHAFDDAAWVGYRLSEIVPVQPLARQKLLELGDPVARLEILHTYLAQRKLVR